MTITINGDLLIGAATLQGSAKSFRAVNPATGEQIEPAFGAGTVDDVERACTLAGKPSTATATPAWKRAPPSWSKSPRTSSTSARC